MSILLAAVGSIAAFATLTMVMLTATNAVVISGTAEVEHARAAAAADAGVAMVLHGLLTRDAERRWPIDGRTRQASFEGFRLALRVEDERGKVPLNRIDERAATALFEAHGLDGDRLVTARDSLLDWIDEDDEPRPFGAESDHYAAKGHRARNGDILSLDELGGINGFDAELVARLKQVVTLRSGDGVFDPRFAQPIAIGVMGGGGAASVEVIDRAREIAGQRVALPLAQADRDIIRRPLTIVITARSPGGTRAERHVLIELTGIDGQPYVIHDYG